MVLYLEIYVLERVKYTHVRTLLTCTIKSKN